MNRDEAIAIIRKEYLCVDRDCDIERNCGKCDLMMPSKEPILEAYKIAIKALEQMPTKEEEALLQKWRDNRGISMEEFEDAMNTLDQEPCEDAISRAEAIKIASGYCHPANVAKELAKLPSVTPQPKTGWNNHQIACMLADLFGDACACNYNGIDEWLGEICDFKDTCCPNPVGVACWEQFLKYSQSRYTECGYEVRDKNALQEPKTGYWEQYGNSWEDKFKCSECGKEQPKILCGEQIIGHWSDYCPNCGCRMVEPQESEDT